MANVKPKKHLGQHFLNDESIARRIVGSLTWTHFEKVLEIGPGMGVLTKYLLEDNRAVTVAEIDTESVTYLKKNYPSLENNIIEGDILKEELSSYFVGEPTAIIGNFPYNISSQIFFKVLHYRTQVVEVVGMVQKEVAERIASPCGNKKYGILSVLLQAFYDIEYLFTVGEDVFIPPPKVKSAVLRMIRNERTCLPCDEKLFTQVVKQGFNNRRKTLRNALKPLNLPPSITTLELLGKRAEQLDVETFIELTKMIQKSKEDAV